ncbi:hypothetical protein HanPI659440_Chr03g0112521 [Helianthus annuus]|nr:hypothetical protein HanPI659440_Chr03g0112521 [Helianthus annuus]
MTVDGPTALESGAIYGSKGVVCGSVGEVVEGPDGVRVELILLVGSRFLALSKHKC